MPMTYPLHCERIMLFPSHGHFSSVLTLIKYVAQLYAAIRVSVFVVRALFFITTLYVHQGGSIVIFLFSDLIIAFLFLLAGVFYVFIKEDAIQRL